MKINVEFDLTPAEFRNSLGLPDVEVFQRNTMDRIQQHMEAGVEGYDPWKLMQPFMQTGSQNSSQGLSQGMANFGNYQQMMMDMFRQAGSNAMASSSNEKGNSDKESSEKDSEKEDSSKKSGSASSASSSTASSSRSASSRSSGSKARKTQNDASRPSDK